MAAPLILRNLSWALTTLLEVVLLLYLVRRRLYRSHPAFFIYILVVILQSAILAASYSYFGTESARSYDIGWGSQGVVVCARWFAVMEIARKALAEYAGIWAMASRILFVLAVCVLVYSIASSGSRWTLVVLNADRSAELCIASFIVGMFLFVRYYRIPMANLERMLAIGFCLYSCFFVINDTIYEKWLRSASSFWNHLDMLTYFASLLLWIGAVHQYSATRNEATPTPLNPELYGELSQKLNSRLHLLNNRLDQLFRSGGSRS
jgi:hypothetical protein